MGQGASRPGRPGRYPDFNRSRDWLAFLAHMVARRMRRHGYSARVVHFTAESPDGWGGSMQKTLSVATDDESIIFEACVEIAAKLGDRDRLPPEVQYIGVSVSKLSDRTAQPIQLFESDRSRTAVLEVMDRINDEHGDFSVYFGGLHTAKTKINAQAANRGMYRDIRLG